MVAETASLGFITEERVRNQLTGGEKGSKPARFDLVPGTPLWELALAYGAGAQKYADRNWERGINFSLLFASAMRHLQQWWAGWRFDEEQGVEHLASVLFHCCALLELQRTHPECDDRPARVNLSPHYLAGILDGEGYLGAVHRAGRGKGEVQTIVQVEMVDRAIPESFHLLFGGSLRKVEKKSRPTHRPTWCWRVQGRGATRVCEALRDYLVLKQEQADLIIELQHQRRNPGRRGLTELEIAKRLELVEQLRALNRRGRGVRPLA